MTKNALKTQILDMESEKNTGCLYDNIQSC